MIKFSKIASREEEGGERVSLDRPRIDKGGRNG